MTVFLEFPKFTEIDTIETAASLIRDDGKFLIEKDELICISAPNLGSTCSFENLPASIYSVFDVSEHETTIFEACLAFARGEKFRLMIRVDERGSFDVFKFSADPLHLLHIDRQLSSGKINAAAASTNPIRRQLQEVGSSFASEVAEVLRHLLCVNDCLVKCSTPIYAEDGDILRKRGVDSDSQYFVSSHLEAFRFLASVSPVVLGLIDDNFSFYRDGKALADAAFRKRAPDFSFLVWLSIYFFRLSSSRLANGDSSAALALLVRVLEYYSIYILASVSVIYFDGGSFRWRSSAAPIGGGAGELWGDAVTRIDPDVQKKLESSLHLCDEAISLRNRSVFGHGMQKLRVSEVAGYAKAVRNSLELIEKSSLDGGARWESLWMRSQPLSFNILRTLIGEVTVRRQVH